MLVRLLPVLQAAFSRWLEDYLGGAPEAVHVVTRHGQGGPDRVIKYMAKGTGKATAMRYGLIDPHAGWDYCQGIVPFKRWGCSKNIGKSAQQAWARSWREKLA